MKTPTLRARNVTRGTVLAEYVEDGGSFWSKFMGLMLRPPLAAGHGLWMPGENGIHMFFMRFAIDVVFVGPPVTGRVSALDAGPRPVLAVRRACPPWRGIVPLIAGSKGVLELPVGTLDATGTTVGDEIVVEAK